jgi:SOS response regulatory protein OraA/RecX
LVEARTAALDCALRALAHRDRTRSEIEGHLRARGFSDVDCRHVIVALRRTGLVDDERFAQTRAASLAGRDAGDALIHARLVEAGVTKDDADVAVATLDSEATRARRIVSTRGASPKTARYLYGKGFSEDVVADAVADGADGELG